MTEIVSERWDEANPIPDKWMLRPLGSLGQWLSGGTPSMKNEAYWGGGIPWVSPKDMKRPRLHDSINHVSELALSNGTKLAPRHALFVVVRGMILAHSFPVARTERAMAFNQDIKALVPHDHVDSDYLLWWLTANRNSFLAITTESTHGTKRLPTEALFAKEVLLPPLPEQRAIAAALSDVDALIERLDALIAKKRAVKTATMQRLLTGQQRLPGFDGAWETRRLGEISRVVAGQSPLSKHYNEHGAGLPLIQGNADINDRRSIERVWTTHSPKTCTAGDLLLTVRAPVGHVAVATSRSCLGRGVCSLADVGIDSSFLFQALVYSEPRWESVQQGSTFTSASTKQVENFSVHVPPSTSEQQAISNILSDMDAEIKALQARRDKTQAIKQGMMQELLTGRTRLV